MPRNRDAIVAGRIRIRICVAVTAVFVGVVLVILAVMFATTQIVTDEERVCRLPADVRCSGGYWRGRDSAEHWRDVLMGSTGVALIAAGAVTGGFAIRDRRRLRG